METPKRETKEFKSKNGNIVVHYTYLTGREANEVQMVYLKDAKVNVIGQEVKVDGFSPALEFEANKKLLSFMIVSLNGDNQNVVDRLLDLPNDEYEEIVKVIDGISNKKKDK